MGFRIQPLDIEVPRMDLFENDMLDRRPTAELLTKLVSKIEGHYVLAVEGNRGNGKTTFLKMRRQHLANERFPAVSFNAWETDVA